MKFLYSTFSPILLTGPGTAIFNFVKTEGQALASAIVIGVGIYLLIKRESAKFFSFVLLGGGALLFIFSPSSMVTWLEGLFKSLLGIS